MDGTYGSRIRVKMSPPVNPYIAGNPLWGDHGFFGRADILQWVENELSNPGTNALVLFGQRRVGKTSVLLRLQRSLPISAFQAVYYDLQDQATKPLGDVLEDLADAIYNQLGLDLPHGIDFDNSWRSFQREFLPRIFQQLEEHQRLVLLFDEFDVLDQIAEQELTNNAAAKSLLPFLRRLMNEETKLAFVFVAGRRPEDLSLDFSQTFKASLSRELWVLTSEEARSLVFQAEENGTLEFSQEAVDRILTLSHGHPYLTQLLCQRIWEHAYSKKPKSTPQIQIVDVDNILSDALKTGNQALHWLWDGLLPAEQVYAAALAEISDGTQPISEDQVVQILSAHAARLRTREVELAPRDLIQRKVIERIGDQTYRFAVELFRLWVRENRSLQTVKNHLDQVDQTAERIYQVGEGYFRRREWEQAISDFRRALSENPHHFRAQHYLGEALLELNRTEEAVKELQKAYNLDRDQTRLPLARAWIAHAYSLEQAGNEDGALRACDEALKISPQEQRAKDLLNLIWNQRGEKAWNEDDFDTALFAYKQVDNQEKIQIIKNRQHEDEELGRRFIEGVSTLQKGNWTKAIEAFQWIVQKRPAYEQDGYRAAHLLAEAVDMGEQPPHPFLMWLRKPQNRVGAGVFIALLIFAIFFGIGSNLVTQGFNGEGPLAGLATDTPTVTPTFTPTPTDTPSPTLTNSPTLTPTRTPTNTSTPSITPTQTDTPTVTLTPTITPIPTEITDSFGHTMSLIPAGSFDMGSKTRTGDESPSHNVILDGFYIDQYEVTNSQYAVCVDNGSCPDINTSLLRNIEFVQHPVVNVNWFDAKSYCEWRNARLPFEAEWEKAARGGLEDQLYPWGDSKPSCDFGATNGAQFYPCEDTTQPIGSFSPNGYGLYDMVGNVWEWVADWYNKTYYSSSPIDNPTGPEYSGSGKVVRGGGWDTLGSRLYVTSRHNKDPFERNFIFGFRCVVSVPGP